MRHQTYFHHTLGAERYQLHTTDEQSLTKNASLWSLTAFEEARDAAKLAANYAIADMAVGRIPGSNPWKWPGK